MGKRIQNYVEFIKAFDINGCSKEEAIRMREEMTEQMDLFIRERLIQLLLIIAIALLTMMCYICVQVSNSTIFMLLAMLLIISIFAAVYLALGGGPMSMRMDSNFEIHIGETTQP